MKEISAIEKLLERVFDGECADDFIYQEGGIGDLVGQLALSLITEDVRVNADLKMDPAEAIARACLDPFGRAGGAPYPEHKRTLTGNEWFTAAGAVALSVMADWIVSNHPELSVHVSLDSTSRSGVVFSVYDGSPKRTATKKTGEAGGLSKWSSTDGRKKLSGANRMGEMAAFGMGESYGNKKHILRERAEITRPGGLSAVIQPKIAKILDGLFAGQVASPSPKPFRRPF